MRGRKPIASAPLPTAGRPRSFRRATGFAERRRSGRKLDHSRIGVITNGLFAFSLESKAMLLVVRTLARIYIAAHERLEKPLAAEMLPRERRSPGLGVLASANAIGDRLSSIGVGRLITAGYSRAAFLGAAGLGRLGTLWMLAFSRRRVA
jgi:hypothetical protein